MNREMELTEGKGRDGRKTRRIPAPKRRGNFQLEKNKRPSREKFLFLSRQNLPAAPKAFRCLKKGLILHDFIFRAEPFVQGILHFRIDFRSDFLFDLLVDIKYGSSFVEHA